MRKYNCANVSTQISVYATIISQFICLYLFHIDYGLKTIDSFEIELNLIAFWVSTGKKFDFSYMGVVEFLILTNLNHLIRSPLASPS